MSTIRIPFDIESNAAVKMVADLVKEGIVFEMRLENGFWIITLTGGF